MLNFKGGAPVELQRERLDRSYVAAKLAALRRDYPAALREYSWSKLPERRRALALETRRMLRLTLKG